MTLAHALLGVLSEGPEHGYDLKRAYDERFPATKPLAYGQVYAALASMEKRGEVEQLETMPGNGPERTVYAITDVGRTALDRWLGQTEPAGQYAAIDLVRKTVTALRLGGDAAGFLQRQRADHLEAMRRLRHQIAETDELAQRIALDHTLTHLDADLQWLEASRLRIVERTRR
ncbi:PadR family transcriptional regulator [Mumia sp. zg.B53]|uniref:PadR family transcriptional regulator n=1 Tax=unclassified Mumia TaxID=2621872 RepID=UPI001C6E3593|nr:MULTISPECIES: PadR family transcriptional regulator [unclassified Mumia]MBW9208241.1 PadR family transcriptional regulator [Mumia sp. zg.B21]MBW9216197.1 PadR family transcriptional regulator [Mumia sp. zg.B53]